MCSRYFQGTERHATIRAWRHQKGFLGESLSSILSLSLPLSLNLEVVVQTIADWSLDNVFVNVLGEHMRIESFERPSAAGPISLITPSSDQRLRGEDPRHKRSAETVVCKEG